MDQVTERPTGTPAPEAGAQQPGGERLFAGGGEIGSVLAGIDWSSTALGPVATWSHTLCTSLRICLTSRHPIILWWGPDLVIFYNDAYAPTLGIKRPWAAGRAGREVWSEIWDVIGPMLEGVLRTGEPTWSDDQLLYLERSGYPEETYHTFSYSPIEDDTGAVVGVFTAVTETTQRVLSDRRTRLARDLAAALVDARSTEEVCTRAARVLADDPADIPYALLYAVESRSHCATLIDSSGLPRGTTLSPVVVDLHAAHAAPAGRGDVESDVRMADPWALAQAVSAGQEILVRDIPWSIGDHGGEAGLSARAALVLPLVEPGQATPTAVLVAGVSPSRELDAEYRAFYTVLAGHMATALAAAHAYEQERQRAEALADIDRAKTAFFSNVSHEFRTPLTLLLGPVEDSLNDPGEPPSPRQRERLEVMQRNGGRLLKLVNTLLDFARIEAGRVQASYEPIDLAAYTAELASAFRSLVEKAGLELVVDCRSLAHLSTPIYVDRDMWEKIVLNLLSNAFKFTLDGSIAVMLRADDDGQHIELVVRDTGIGIPRDELPRLFERFHRVEGARSRTHEGSGIGLALVQELVHLHGGTIRAESAVGEGTAFFVRLAVGTAHLPADHISTPAALSSTTVSAATFVQEAERWLPPEAFGADTPVAPVLSDAPARPRMTKTERPTRIVLADDNADMRDYLRRLLGERYVVEAAANGMLALEAIRRAPPDLVLSDVMMPELDGYGLLRALRDDPTTATLPVILLSARAGEEATTEGLEAGADDYLVKPFSARELLARVEARLEIARTRAEAEQRTHEALEAMLETARWIISAEEVSGVSDAARELAALAHRIVGCEIVSLMGVDEAGAIVPLATLGRTEDNAAAWFATIGHHHVADFYAPEQLQRLLAGKVQVVKVAENTARGIPAYGTGTTATAPLISEGKLRGVLSFAYTDASHQYGHLELELAAAFARMALLVLDRERLLRERTQARAEALVLAEATRRMDEFLGIASHELRTPLTSVAANVQLAARSLGQVASSAPGVLPDQQASRLQRAHALLERTSRQTARLDRLVGDLLDVSRIQAGKLELRPEPCDLATIAREAVQEQRAAWPKRNITLDLSRRTTLPLHADADRIGQVATNLLTNALKYSLAERPVAVRLRVDGAMARLEVRDQGPGLTADQQTHLWERFYRVPGVEQQSGSGVGLGLGLHICKTIIERHGGQVGVDSVEGEGSTFWFTLPLSPAKG